MITHKVTFSEGCLIPLCRTVQREGCCVVRNTRVVPGKTQLIGYDVKEIGSDILEAGEGEAESSWPS